MSLQDQAAAFAQWRTENPDKAGESTTRGYSETAVALPGLWQDVDVLGPAHKEARLPPTKEAARALIEGFPLTPTIVVDSGHGLQPWWLFRGPWTFENAAERQAAQTLARRFLATMQERAKARGWVIDPTSDLARLMRLHGTWNRKLQPVPVQVIELSGVRYNPSDFEPYLSEVAPEASPRQPWHAPSGALAPALKHCRFLQHCRDDASTLSEPAWWAMVSNLARLDGGQEAIHALSAPYLKYTIRETDAKIRHTLKGPGPHTCGYIQQQLGFSGCPPGGCGVRAPAALGVSSRALRTAEEQQRHQDNEAGTGSAGADARNEEWKPLAVTVTRTGHWMKSKQSSSTFCYCLTVGWLSRSCWPQ